MLQKKLAEDLHWMLLALGCCTLPDLLCIGDGGDREGRMLNVTVTRKSGEDNACGQSEDEPTGRKDSLFGTVLAVNAEYSGELKSSRSREAANGYRLESTFEDG
jgi:hypothetical protein